ncbi:hypothetical protein EV421DRAFT_596983 [Armillaria borealis]|uniref:Secreted protein n=1 Tax=Armillaria borealis TaxID=47425 RepID=A0AA39MPC4_9AGAR|nr:hypothetical protein EV421DRAFT_596983 [Armillaria borealis]
MARWCRMMFSSCIFLLLMLRSMIYPITSMMFPYLCTTYIQRIQMNSYVQVTTLHQIRTQHVNMILYPQHLDGRNLLSF